MEKKYALIFSFLITGLIASNVYLFSTLSANPMQSAIISRVIDGDTLVIEDDTTIRLVNINAPEKNTQQYNSSLTLLKQFENKTIFLEPLGSDKYQRTLARIYSQDETYLNLQLVALGFASKFLVQDSETRDFAKAEEKAIKNSLGIWYHSPHYNCFTSEIDKYGEIITLTNNCQEINLAGFKLKDESRKIYTFPEISFSQKLLLNSVLGEDNSTDLFWNSKTNIWNNDRDSLYIFDKNSTLAHYHSYGY